MNYYKNAGITLQALDLESADDWDDVKMTANAPKFTFHAVCSSEYCAGGKMQIEKVLDRSHDVCPDCEEYLFWERRSVS